MAEQKKAVASDNFIDQLLVFGSGLVYLTKDSAEDIIKALEDNNLLNDEDGKKMANEIREKFASHKDALKNSLVGMLRDVVDEVGLATKDDLKK